MIKEQNLTIIPRQEVAFGKEAAKNLMDIVSHKEKKLEFNGKQYLEFQDWQTLGRFFGLSVKTGDTEVVTIDEVKGAKAQATIYNAQGIILGGAQAYCMSDEPNWAKKPFFQLASMAQTRAGAKALRNTLSWVAVLAGFAATSAEEMEQEISQSFYSHTKDELATEKQKNMIFALTKKLGGDKNMLEKWTHKDTEKFSKKDASTVIERLQKEIKKRNGEVDNIPNLDNIQDDEENI